MADNYLERQASRAWDMDCYYMGRCGGDAVLMTAEIGMLAKGAVDATLAVYDGLKAAVGIGSDGGGFRLVSLAGGGQTVLAPAGVAVAEGTVEGILGGVAEGSLSGFGFHTINDFLDNLAKIDADRVFGGDGPFSVGGRDFDGGVGNRWWEAKSGGYWSMLEKDSSKLAKFKSDMGDRLRIATENGATYELFSNTPIPESIRQWLIKKGIHFTELLD